jgi:lysophospholipase L1-like esterase
MNKARRSFTLITAMATALAFAGAARAWLPEGMGALGDSLTQAYGSSGSLVDNPSASWSTGTDPAVNSHAQRLGRLTTAVIGNASNEAVSGSKISSVPGQASDALADGAEYVTILSGTNDVCKAATQAGMTSVADYGSTLHQALTTLSNGLPAQGKIFVASIPDWLKLRNAFAGNSNATAAWAANNVCPLIFGSSATSSDRSAADQRIQDYNARAQTECAQFSKCTSDGGAVFGLTFNAADLAPDFFHLSKSGQAKLAAATWNVGPFASRVVYYDSLTKDGKCAQCRAVYEDPVLTVDINRASNSQDTAYGTKDFGGGSGVSGRVFTRTNFSLAPGQTLGGNLRIFQALDTEGSLVYEVFLTSSREIRLRSPAGGLRSTAFTLRSGVTVPNDGSTISIEVSALRNSSVTLRVNGVDRASKGGLSGATTGNQRYLTVGILRYDGTATNSVRALHANVGTSTTDWLGAGGGGGGGDTTAPADPIGLGATVVDSRTVDLDWANNGESDLAGYNVYRSASSGGPYTKLNGALVGSSQYTDANAPSDATSFYQVTAVDTSDNESGPSNTARATTPPPPSGDMGPFEAFTTDSGCVGCSLSWSDPVLTATIAGGANDVDTAYATDDAGGSAGLSGRVVANTTLSLANGQTLEGQLYVLQLADVNGDVIYQLYLNQARVLRLLSPAGGLGSTSINESAGVTVPNDGTSIEVEVSALRNDSVVVRVNGVETVNVANLSGATTANPRRLHVGILQYAGTSTSPVTVRHAGVGVRTSSG